MQTGINIALVMRENPLNLELKGLSVAERLDAYAGVLREQIERMAAGRPQGPSISCGRKDEVTLLVDVEGGTQAERETVLQSIRSFRKFVEYAPEGIFGYLECQTDLAGFILLARRGVPATVVHEEQDFRLRYIYLANHIFVKEVLYISPELVGDAASRLAGKTMFTDVPAGKFSEHYLGGPFSELSKFFGPLKDELAAIAARDGLPSNPEQGEPLGQEFSEEVSDLQGARLVPVRRIISSPGHGMFENILFLDKAGKPLPTTAYLRSRRSERPEDFSQVDMLDADAFFLAYREAIETVVCEHWQLMDVRYAAVYQRSPRLEMFKFLEDYPKIEFLPLYEFFSNFNLLDIAAELYEYGLTYLRMDERRVVSCSVVGDVKRGPRQFCATLQSLSSEFVRGVVLDLKLAKSWHERRTEISALGRWARTHEVPLRIVLRATEAESPPSWLAEAAVTSEMIFTYVDQAESSIFPPGKL